MKKGRLYGGLFYFVCSKHFVKQKARSIPTKPSASQADDLASV